MPVNLHIFQASGRLEPFEDQIRKAADEVIADVAEVISVPNVDIFVADLPHHAMEETGVAGRTLTKHCVRISIDPESEEVQNNLEKRVKSSIAHELHHCSRWDQIGRPNTFLELLVEEGLADHFDIEINGGKPKPWSVAVQGERLAELKQQAQKQFDKKDYDYDGWFFGSQRKEIPQWAGYSIAFSLVGDYLKQTGKSAAELTDQPAEAFV